MRLTRFIVILAMSFMFAQWAVAGFPPVRIGGILQSLVTKFTLLFPAKSVVNRGGVTAYIDTDVANLLHDGSFEGIALSTDWTFSGGTTSFETADKVDGNQSLRITASASTPVLRQTVSTKSGLPLVVGCMVKTDQNFVEVCAKDNTADVLCTDVPSDNTWRFLKFPIVAGNDGGIEVRSSQNITGNIDVDKCRVEYSDTTQDIAQSELAFDVNIGGNNINVTTAKSSYTEVIDSGLDMIVNSGSNLEIPCSGTNPSTGLTCSAGSEGVGIVFEAKVGKYEICAQYTHYTPASTVDSYVTYQLTETPNNSQTILQEGNSRVQVGSNAPNGNEVHLFSVLNCGSFNFNTAGKKTIRLMYEKPSSTTANIFADRAASVGQRDIHITGKYYPPKTKIVTQLQEETVQTANEFSAKISNTGVILSENLDWINGTTCPIVGVNRRCTLNDLGITSPMACVISAENVDTTQANQIEAEFEAITTTYIDYNMTISGVGNNNLQASIKCQKQGADYNKSRMVYGQFEQIKTTELCQVEAKGAVAGAVTIGNPYSWATEIKDDCNAWDGTIFIAPRDSFYSISGIYRAASVQDMEMNMQKLSSTNVVLDTIGVSYQLSDIISNIAGGVYLEAGQKIRFINGSATVTPSLVDTHWRINIYELPDLAGIVKNLNEGGGFLQAPNTANIKTCYYAFGGAGSLTSPTVCSSSPCTEYYDSCGTASPPNRAVVGNYRSNGVVWSSGTWKPNTPMYCSCETQESGVGNHLACDIRRTLVFASDSSGGYYVDPFTYTFAGTSQDGVVTIKCEGEAP